MTIDPITLTRSIPGPTRKPKKEPVREEVIDQLNRTRNWIVDEKATLTKLNAREKELIGKMSLLHARIGKVTAHLQFHQKKERRLEAVLSTMKEKT